MHIKFFSLCFCQTGYLDRRIALTFCLGACLLAFGCKRPALYEIQARPTAILVDDPKELMGMTGQTEAVALRIDRDLRERIDGMDAMLVPQSQVTLLRRELEKDFNRTAIDRIGRALQAEQVIHVEITQAQARSGAGTIQPSATAQVKIIDVMARRRLFPDTPAPDAPGHAVAVEMPIQAVTVENANAAESQGMGVIGQKLGREIARLFYAFDPGDPREFDRSLGDLNRTGPRPMPN